jgi:exopolysaccharide biosynthesis protein
MKKKTIAIKPKVRSYRYKKTTYLLIIIDIIAILCFFMFYGPFASARDLWITTAMGTTTHKYFARTFFNNETIIEVLKNNRVINSDDSTDIDSIKVGDFEDTGVYESIYEEQILKRESKDQVYKIIPIKENGYKGFLVAVYDPARVSLYVSPKLDAGGEIPTKMAKDSEAIVLINAGGHYFEGSKLVQQGTITSNGKMISRGSFNGYAGLIGFTKDNVLVLTEDTPQEYAKYDFRDTMNFGPFLIVNGKESFVSGTAGGIQPRTVIGQRKDGIVLFLIIDGRSAVNGLGATFVDLTKIMVRYKAWNAANLDGGGSTSLVAEQKLVNNPCGYGYCDERHLANAWIVK